MISNTPYWRLAAVYFGYFAVIGGISPYWSAYLDDLGFAPQIIGLLAAIPMITRLLAPYVWGYLADATGRRLTIVRIGALGAVLSFVAVLFRQDFWTLLLATFAFSFFWNAILPQFEGITLSHLGSRSNEYSRIRLWGSIGFIVMVLVLGALFDVVSIAWLPACLMIGLVWVALVSFSLPDANVKPADSGGEGLWQVFKKPTVLSFFIAVFMLQISHGVYYGFYTLYLQEHGYSRLVISGLWTLGVVAEIVLFIYVPKILERFSLRQCLIASLLAASVRWLVIGIAVDNWWVIAGVQVAHALTFGMVHVVAMAIVREYFGERLQGRGQALYSAVGFGAGAAIGTYAAGWLWLLGGVWAFIFAAVIALLATCVAYVGMPRVACNSSV